jgi:hypothetical protein
MTADEKYMSKIVKRIKQIAPIESGWVHQCLIESTTENGKFTIGESRITGQALVERSFPDRTVTDDVELLVFDNGDLMSVNDYEEFLMSGTNTYPLGVCPPDFRFSLENLTEEIANYYEKKEEHKKEVAVRRAARSAARIEAA